MHLLRVFILLDHDVIRIKISKDNIDFIVQV